MEHFGDGPVGVLRLFAPFEDGDVAALETEGPHIGSDVGAGFVDHPDDPDGHRDLLDAQIRLIAPPFQNPADGLTQRGDLAQ